MTLLNTVICPNCGKTATETRVSMIYRVSCIFCGRVLWFRDSLKVEDRQVTETKSYVLTKDEHNWLALCLNNQIMKHIFNNWKIPDQIQSLAEIFGMPNRHIKITYIDLTKDGDTMTELRDWLVDEQVKEKISEISITRPYFIEKLKETTNKLKDV